MVNETGNLMPKYFMLLFSDCICISKEVFILFASVSNIIAGFKKLQVRKLSPGDVKSNLLKVTQGQGAKLGLETQMHILPCVQCIIFNKY